MKNTRIMFFGTPEFAVRILETLIRDGYDVIATVSQPDRPVGRKKIIQPTPVHACSNEHGIPCLQPEKLSDIREQIVSLSPDLFLTCAYGQFIPSSILSIPQKGCLNIHPSLLPKYRGGAPIHHTHIGEDETFFQLNERLMDISCQLVHEQLPLYLKGELKGTPQDEDQVVLGLNITKEEEKVSFAQEDIHRIYNHIRGLIEWPVAYGMLEGKRVKFCSVSKQIKEIQDQPGTVLGFDQDSMLVACTGGILHVHMIQMEGKKKMDARSFGNGYGHEVTGKVFE